MNRVVITGMGAVTPIGNSVPEYFQALKEGVCGIGPITKFDTTGYAATVAAEVKDFQPTKRLDRGTVRKSDLFSQYALYASAEAMEQSQISGTVDPYEFGVYLGSGIGGISSICDNEDVLKAKGVDFVSPMFIPKMISNMAAGQIAIRFGCHGSAMSVATACATGTTAIGEAYRAIRNGDLTAAIAGGTEAGIAPLAVAGFIACSALSKSPDPAAACLPFDSRRGGFVMGEGAAVLILEEYAHAKARGAKIYAEVVGYGATCDAYHPTAPSPDGMSTAKAIEKALQGVSYDPSTLYVNAHGTGTQLNDKTETAAFKTALGEGAYRAHISSTKSMTGHMLGAAGAAEALACVLALVEDVIPPTVHLEQPDALCDLDYTPGKAVYTSVETAISTSLGFGGHNACLALKKGTL